MLLPVATHSGFVRLGKWELHAYNLDNGQRVFDKASFKDVLALSTGAAGGAALEKIGTHPLLRKHSLSVAVKTFDHPVRFKANGSSRIGFEAESLIDVCKFLLKARELGVLLSLEQLRYAQAAESLLVSLASVGLAALIDEATGYQVRRERDALQALLEKYLKKELAAWAKRFPDEYYKELFRLKHWNWQGRSVNPPQVVGKYTRDIVYRRLAPGIIDELERRNPATSSGDRHDKHHQWLTDDIGHPALAQHLHAVIALMRISKTWKSFLTNLHEAFPVKGDQFVLSLEE